MSLQIGATPTFATPAALANGSGRGPYTVVGGVLAWDPRFDRVPQGMIPLRSGGYARYGSITAAMDFYRVVVELRAEVNRLAEWFAVAAGPGWRFGSPVPPRAASLLVVLVNAEIQWGTALRVLGKLVRAAGLPSSARPRAVAAAGIDLQRIRFTGRADPLSQGATVWVETTRPSGWEALGAAQIARWVSAYPAIARPPLAGARELAADLARQEAEIAELGALPALVWLVVLIVGIGGAVVVLNRAIGAAAMFVGVNTEYLGELNRELAAEHEACLNGDEAACQRWESIAERVESVSSPLAVLGRVLAVGAIGLGVLWLIRRK
jgi:hypothetical protein